MSKTSTTGSILGAAITPALLSNYNINLGICCGAMLFIIILGLIIMYLTQRELKEEENDNIKHSNPHLRIHKSV